MRLLALTVALLGCSEAPLPQVIDSGCHWRFPEADGDMATQPLRPTASVMQADVCQGPTSDRFLVWIHRPDFDFALDAPLGIDHVALDGDHFAMRSARVAACAWSGSAAIQAAQADGWTLHVDATCPATGLHVVGGVYGNTL